MVDKVLQQYQCKADPLGDFVKGRPRRNQYQDADPAKLQTQLNNVSDTLALVIRDRDAAKLEFKQRLGTLDTKLWLLSRVVIAFGALCLFLATQLFSRL